MLRQSLETLTRSEPELVQRICWPVESDHVIVDDSGEVHYRLNQGRYRLSLTDDAVARSLPPGAPEGATLFVFGVGLGEQIDTILSSRADLRVVAWERDPWLLRLALGRNDWSAALASGRLRLLLGSDLVEQASAVAQSATRGLVVLHPFLANIYRNERAWMDEGAGARPRALLCAGGLFSDDLASALITAGFAPYTIDIQRLSTEELERTAQRLRPALIAAINYTDGLAEFAAANGCKLICWEVDPATNALAPCRGPTDEAFLFTYRRAQVAELRGAGFTHVQYLPLAANLARRRPLPLTGADREKYGAPVSFVGSSMLPQVPGFQRSFLDAFAAATATSTTTTSRTATSTTTTASATTAAGGAAALEEILAHQRRDFSRYLVPQAVQRLFPDQTPERQAELARAAAEIAAADKRLAYVSRLARFGMRVWGDDGWLAAQSAGVAYQGPAGHALELTKIYCASLINIDIGRLYQDDIVTMRVFDVLACGGFVLAERSSALAELFEVGTEIDGYGTLEELEAKVAHYLAHPAEAHAIARRGREAVQQRHDVEARVAHMLATAGLTQALAARPASQAPTAAR
jgi:hypothetical protein